MKKYMIGGKEITLNDFEYMKGRLSLDEKLQIADCIREQDKVRAINRMNREKNMETKSVMEGMIVQGNYNFDLLFGPET